MRQPGGQIESTLIYKVNVPVRLPNFEKKPWQMFCDYFWPVKIVLIDWLDSWFYFVQRARNQVNQSESFSLLKDIQKPSVKVFSQNSVIVPVRFFDTKCAYFLWKIERTWVYIRRFFPSWWRWWWWGMTTFWWEMTGNAFFLLDHYLRDQLAISKQHK